MSRSEHTVSIRRARRRGSRWRESLAMVLAVAAVGCAAPTSSPEALCREAVAALRAHDFERYRPLTVTLADFALENNRISGMAAGQSYAGSVLRPQLREQQRLEFEAACAPAGFAWQQVRFAGLGTTLEDGARETLTGPDMRCWTYSVSLKGPDGTIDTASEGPVFVVTKWGDEYRLLAVAMATPSR